jgi:Holliday junction resolvase
MNRKAKGNRNEHKTIKLLESLGYSCFRMAGSLGKFDVIGISATDFVCVQVKSNRMPGTVEIEAIKNFNAPANCRKLIHVWQDRQRLPFVKEV